MWLERAPDRARGLAVPAGPDRAHIDQSATFAPCQAQLQEPIRALRHETGHGEACALPTLHLAPGFGAAGPIRRVRPLGHDPLQAHAERAAVEIGPVLEMLARHGPEIG